MKTTSLWIGMMALVLASCDKEQPAAAETSKLPSLAERRAAAKLKPVEPAAPEAEPPPAETIPEPAVPPPAAAPQPVPLAESTPPAPTREEREARRAEQRQQRVARVTEQATARMKERDANGDGLLSKDEASEWMRRGFDRMDTNGDGSLDAAEQAAAIQAMSERMAGFSERGRDRGRGGGQDRGRFGGRDRRR